ncbi:hypothetical protein AMTR_s00610p00009670 [Amborella trichopoda]|uniref:RanBP2-type domain-containing protein n=1 Tax=Amborella trichopoda TaxID=13333 RepID=W1NTL9_AMBTC|nr:hypothetical protein AMTR_s00610p00009670 [Amborella trichopoda]
MGEGREGDWECGGCQNRNYAFRSFCNRCKQPRLLVDTKTPADSKWLPRIGDWICSVLEIWAQGETWSGSGPMPPGQSLAGESETKKLQISLEVRRLRVSLQVFPLEPIQAYSDES